MKVEGDRHFRLDFSSGFDRRHYTTGRLPRTPFRLLYRVAEVVTSETCHRASRRKTVEAVAAKEGYSVSQFLASAAGEKLAVVLTREYLRREAAGGRRADFEKSPAAVLIGSAESREGRAESEAGAPLCSLPLALRVPIRDIRVIRRSGRKEIQTIPARILVVFVAFCKKPKLSA